MAKNAKNRGGVVTQLKKKIKHLTLTRDFLLCAAMGDIPTHDTLQKHPGLIRRFIMGRFKQVSVACGRAPMDPEFPDTWDAMLALVAAAKRASPSSIMNLQLAFIGVEDPGSADSLVESLGAGEADKPKFVNIEKGLIQGESFWENTSQWWQEITDGDWQGAEAEAAEGVEIAANGWNTFWTNLFDGFTGLFNQGG